MKAKDYFKQFNEENQDKTPECRIINALNGIIREVKDIAKMRNARKNEAMIAIFNEQNTKCNSFIRMINELDYFKENGPICHDALKLYIKGTQPDLYYLIYPENN